MPMRILFALSILISSTLYAQRRDQAAERELFSDANRERVALHLPELQWDDALSRAAVKHTKEMGELQELSHNLPGEPGLGERMAAAGARLSGFGENVGVAGSAEAIHKAWMNSEGHRRNLLNPAFDIVGIAVYQAGGSLYATEDFGTLVKAVSADDADLQVRDAIGEERAAKGLKPLLLFRAPGAAATGCSAPVYDRSNPVAPGGLRSLVNYSTTTPAIMPELAMARVDDRRYRQYTISVCEEHDPAGFVVMRVNLAFLK